MTENLGSVKRSDITVTQNVEWTGSLVGGAYAVTSWNATFDGYLPTGEHLILEREAGTLAKALTELESALNDLGYEVT